MYVRGPRFSTFSCIYSIYAAGTSTGSAEPPDGGIGDGANVAAAAAGAAAGVALLGLLAAAFVRYRIKKKRTAQLQANLSDAPDNAVRVQGPECCAMCMCDCPPWAPDLHGAAPDACI